MKQRTQDLILGVTGLVFLALIVGTIIFLYPLLGPEARLITVHFDHSAGMAPLKAGSPVILGGSQSVGSVENVDIQEVDDPNAPGGKRTIFVVETEIRDGVPLYDDCVITTGEPAIGGSGYVLITDVGTPGNPLEEPVQGQPPVSFSAAINELSERLLAEDGVLAHVEEALDPDAERSVLRRLLLSMQDINQITRRLSEEMSLTDQATLLAKIHRMTDDLNQVTRSIRTELQAGRSENLLAKVHGALDHLDKGLREAAAMLEEDRPLLRDTLTNVRAATETIEQDILGSLRRELDPNSPGSLLDKVHLAMGQVDDSLTNINAVTREGAQLFAVTRPKLQSMLDTFNNAARNIDDLTMELLLNPSKLVLGPSRQREDQLVIFQAARNFAQAAAHLHDATGRLEATLSTLRTDANVDELDAEQLREIQSKVEAAFERFEQAESVLWKEMQ